MSTFRKPGKAILAFALILISSVVSAQNGVSISDDPARQPHASAILDVGVTGAAKQGVLLPKVTNTERATLELIAETGLIIYNTDNNRHEYWTGSAWRAMQSLWFENTNGTDIFYDVGEVSIGPQSGPPTTDNIFRLNGRATFTEDIDMIGNVRLKNQSGFSQGYIRFPWNGPRVYIYNGRLTGGSVAVDGSPGFSYFWDGNPETLIYSLYNQTLGDAANGIRMNTTLHYENDNLIDIQDSKSLDMRFGLNQTAARYDIRSGSAIAGTLSDPLFSILQSNGYVGVNEDTPLSPLHVDMADGGTAFRVSVRNRDVDGGAAEIIDDALLLEAGNNGQPTTLSVAARASTAYVEARGNVNSGGIRLASSLPGTGQPGIELVGGTTTMNIKGATALQPNDAGINPTDLGSVNRPWGNYYVNSTYLLNQAENPNGASFNIRLGNVRDHSAFKGRGMLIYPPANIQNEFGNNVDGYEISHYFGIADNSNTTLYTIGPNGSVGIGLGGTAVNPVSPTRALDVNGQIKMRTGAALDHIVMSDADGTMRWETPANLASILGPLIGPDNDWVVANPYVHTGFDVGIQTATPQAALDVNGGSIFRDHIFLMGDVDIATQGNVTDGGFRFEQFPTTQGFIIYQPRFHTELKFANNAEFWEDNTSTTIMKFHNGMVNDLSKTIQMHRPIQSVGNTIDLVDQESMELHFGTDNSAERFTIKSGSGDVGNLSGELFTILQTNGNVGVGEDNPTQQLDVGGAIRMQTGPATSNAALDHFAVASADGTMRWESPNDVAALIGGIIGPDNDWVVDNPYVHTGFDVGIQTSTPQAGLDVNAGSIFRDHIFLMGDVDVATQGNVTDGGFRFEQSPTTQGFIIYQPRFHTELKFANNAEFWEDNTSTTIMKFHNGMVNDINKSIQSHRTLQLVGNTIDIMDQDGMQLHFGTNTGAEKFSIHSGSVDNGNAEEVFTILQTNGNVGIGEANPGQKLVVDGAIQMRTGPATGGTATDHIAVSNANGVMRWEPASTVATLVDDNDWEKSGSNLLLDPSVTGNIGIGTSTPKADFQLGDKVGLLTVSGNTYLGNNIYNIDGTPTGWRRLTAGPVMMTGMVFGGTYPGSYNIWGGPSGPADVDPGLTRHFQITADGNVGIGVEGPSAKLEVDGKVQAPLFNIEATPLPPSSPVLGDVHFDGDDLRIYTNLGWRLITLQ